jgi:hypothetical protein
LIEQAPPLGLTLVPEESEGSFESATGVCLGAVEGAIVQRDSADKRGRAADWLCAFCAMAKTARIDQPIGHHPGGGRRLTPQGNCHRLRSNGPHGHRVHIPDFFTVLANGSV